MADTKITALTALTAADPINDVLPIVDVSDTTMAASGTTKKISVNNILGCSGTATLASATISGDLTVDTSTLKVDSANNRVGIGTATPGETLDVKGTGNFNNTTGTYLGFQTNAAQVGYIGTANTILTGGLNTELGLLANSSLVIATGALALQRLRVESAGDVTVSTGNVVMSTSGKGIDFSATANGSGTMTSELLNDYEEGTWTIGLTFGGGNTGLIISSNAGRYTKVGRQVTVSGYIQLANKGSSTGSAEITGLPFTIAAPNASYTAASLRLNGVSYIGAFQGFGAVNTTLLALEQLSTLGAVLSLTDANFVNTSSIIFSLTYTV